MILLVSNQQRLFCSVVLLCEGERAQLAKWKPIEKKNVGKLFQMKEILSGFKDFISIGLKLRSINKKTLDKGLLMRTSGVVVVIAYLGFH